MHRYPIFWEQNKCHSDTFLNISLHDTRVIARGFDTYTYQNFQTLRSWNIQDIVRPNFSEIFRHNSRYSRQETSLPMHNN